MPLIVIAGKLDALGARAPARAPVAPTATASAAALIKSFMLTTGGG